MHINTHIEHESSITIFWFWKKMIPIYFTVQNSSIRSVVPKQSRNLNEKILRLLKVVLGRETYPKNKDEIMWKRSITLKDNINVCMWSLLLYIVISQEAIETTFFSPLSIAWEVSDEVSKDESSLDQPCIIHSSYHWGC